MINNANQINSKIKELTKSMNKLLAKEKEEEDMEPAEQNYEPQKRLLPTIRQNIFEDGEFYYKYNAKIEEQLK